ncbi:MAG: maleylpyruvate isomerase N-terminal domain-containing protein [Acidimicrobiales bacterium]
MTVGDDTPWTAADELAALLAGCRASHRTLLDVVGPLDEAAARRSSRLEHWTVGHVLTHLARNAASHTRMLRAALVGDAVEQYAGGGEERAEAIEAGAGRSAPELVADVVQTTAELEATWDAMTPSAWGGHGLSRGRPWPCRTIPWLRWREVEIHLVDLGVGYEPHRWPAAYVARELPLALATLSDRVVDDDQRRHLLAWLLGRADAPGEVHLEAWGSRPDHYFKDVAG